MNRQQGTGDGPGGAKYAWCVVVVLMFTYTVAFIDRQILSLLVQPIRHDLDLNDTQIGLLGGIAVLTGYTGGPTLVAMLNDFVFRDDSALNYSLAIVSGALTPIGVILLIWGLKPYREPRTAAAEGDAADDGRH